MAKGRLRRLAVIGAAIGGVIFFWRKKKGGQDTYGAASSSTIDYGAVSGTPDAGAGTPTAE